MLHIIGLGLADERDVSVKGLEIIKNAERVYLEAYTAVLLVDQSVLVRTTDPKQIRKQEGLAIRPVHREAHKTHTWPSQ